MVKKGAVKTDKYNAIIKKLAEKGQTVTAMESCTGGLIASLLTDQVGASAVFRGSCVTYSNEEKIRCGVSAATIETFGVYSRETAQEMAKVCALRYSADLGIGITGSLSRPDPENGDSVTGQVYIGVYYRGNGSSLCVDGIKGNSRHEEKMQAADKAADLILKILG